MYFSVLASGSRANCTVVATDCGATILVDCGLSYIESVKRLELVGVNPSDITDIIVSHSHIDHVRGLAGWIKRRQVRVHLSLGTAKACGLAGYGKIIQSGVKYQIAGVEVEPFAVPHDDPEPLGFKISTNTSSLLHLTDCGRITPLISFMAQGVSAMILESNHDLETLHGCDYPWHVKQRIASPFGHLSNCNAAGFITDLISDNLLQKLERVVLAHLSERSNTPDLALAAFLSRVTNNNFTIECANQRTPTALNKIGVNY